MPNDPLPRRPAARWVTLILIVALALAGVRWAASWVAPLVLADLAEQDIRQYAAPKAEAPEKVSLIGVIYPHGDMTWFFKLMGPESAVAAQAETVRTFMNSVRFTDNGDKPVQWDLPEGWQPVMDAKATPDRYATLRIEARNTPTLELTVTKFPGAAGGVLDNVNRWRKQVGLPPIGNDELGAVTTRQTLKGGDVTIVKATGPGAKPGSGAPFMNLPGAAAPQKPAFHYTKPDGWEDAPDAGGGIAAAGFRAKDGAKAAEITVTPLPGDAGGLLQNLNRWRTQVKLDPLTEDQVKDLPKVDVAGESVPLLDTGEGAGQERIVGAVVPHGQQTWFFKMKGSSAVVEKQKSRFTDFLKSAKFDGGKGGDQ